MTLFSKNIFYIAHKFLRSKHQHASIKIMIYVCALGIMIATCSLALIVSIMSGFERATYQKMQSIYPDIIIDGDQELLDRDGINNFFATPHTGIAHWTTHQHAQALVLNPEHETTPHMIMLRGIEPLSEARVSSITTKIKEPLNATLDSLLTDDGIIIGSKMAQNVDLAVNDTVYILCPQDSLVPIGMQFQNYPARVAGIFQTGLDDFDTSLVYCNQTLFEQIFNQSQPSQVHIKLSDKKHEPTVKENLQQYFNAAIYSWKELFPTLLSALKLEKWAMFLILILIVLVASMNIISLIFMYVTQKQRDIIILLCMGMTRPMIRAIFIWISLSIAIPSTLIGLGTAWTIGILLQTYPCIKLPDNIYDTDYIPVDLDLTFFCVILAVTICISLCATLFATRNIDKINVVELLKSH